MNSRAFPDRTFEAIVFDWDGTAVADRRADATAIRSRVEALCQTGVDVAVVSGTHVGNVDGQLGARPPGPGHLYLCLNRGSEVYEVGPEGPRLRWRRAASRGEEAALDAAAAATLKVLAAHGLGAEVVSARLNRRKIDLIPLPEWSDPPKSRIAPLLSAVLDRLAAAGVGGLGEVVDLATEAGDDAGLRDAKVTTDAKHVEIGLTDKGDSARWVLGDLWERGVGPGLVLVGGDEFGPLGGVPGSDSRMLVPEADRAYAVSVGVEPEGVPFGVVELGGGPKMFVGLLDDQLARRRDGRVPSIDEDPAWTLTFDDGPPELARVRESILTLADGRFGTRGALEEDGAESSPLVVASGVYVDGERGLPHLLPGPTWFDLDVEPRGAGRRILDLHTGVLWRERSGPGKERALRVARFASLRRPGVMALRAEGPPPSLRVRSALGLPSDAPIRRRGRARFGEWARTSEPRGGGIVAGARQDRREVAPGLRAVDRVAAYAGHGRRRPRLADVAQPLRSADAAGFDALLREHRAAWAHRWEDAEVSIEGDPEAELAVRFALFHLMSTASDAGEAAVGARGLSGEAYSGHVFWDADIFVLPVLAAIHPGSARAMLEYRIRRLPAALHIAAARRCEGARFPWESAEDGSEATPPWVSDTHGHPVPIRTGTAADHIAADVAWAAIRYAQWTGDDGFLRGPGRPLVVEAARYFASRVRFDDGGRGHLYGVIGPDEYHEIVDDDAFTNVMARWTLRQAAGLAEGVVSGQDRAEPALWRSVAAALVDGFDPVTGIYEQFSGFHALEPLIITELSAVPVAADLLLGRDRVGRAQVLKQPDVLMLHLLVEDEVAPNSLVPNLDFYGPRTAHGSSLSPAVHAALLARAGRAEEALEVFRMAARLDLDDLTGSTAGGLHMATMGGLWQALVHGFLGARVVDDELLLDPHLPREWRSVDVRMRFRGRRVCLHAGPDRGWAEALEPPPAMRQSRQGAAP